MNEEQKKWDVVPFDTFEQYLGPRYENVPGVEYILENGTLLYFMEEAPGVYESADHTVTGATDKPKLYVPVYDGDELQPSSFAEVGAREQFAAITDFTVTMGLPGVNQRQEPGFVLDNGLVLLESERDSQGNYKAGAGMDGMFLQTGRVFAPIRYDGGEIIAFVEQPRRGNVSRNRQRPRNRKSLPVSIRAIPFWKAWTLAAWSLFWGRIQRPYSLLSPGGAWTAAAPRISPGATTITIINRQSVI